MRLVYSSTHDPYFNLAAEEYLLRNYREELLFLYVNDPSVVVGKHQNLLAEIDYRFVMEHNVRIARRITGGGAVFHDHGNLNYAFFSSSTAGNQVNFQKYLQWVILVLEKLGISAVFEGKNNLRVEGFKISGNAGHVFKNIALHHGTLLVNANLQLLSACLKGEQEHYIDKAVKSVRTKVANLIQFRSDISIERLVHTFSEVIQSPVTGFTESEINIIEQLASEKFRGWDWVWGYSPPYTFRRQSTPWGTLQLEVEKGKIVHAFIETQPHWAEQLVGLPHDCHSLAQFVLRSGLSNSDVWWFF
ncbi:MAG: lipoate--protein ligase family protein [Bacteroidales bacterium]